MSVILISIVYKIAAYDWLYSQYWGRVKMVDIASEFIGNIEDWRLFLACQLCLFGSVKRQN